MSVETKVDRRVIRHTEEELNWAKETIKKLPKISAKYIAAGDIISEYKRLFNKDLSVAGMYSWLRLENDPSLKKEKRDRANEYQRLKRRGELPQNNAKFLREKETFEKSNILTYINHNIIGFENEAELKDFLMKSQVIGDNVSVFKRTPIKIEYNITIGA